jgi:hypothetical protein
VVMLADMRGLSERVYEWDVEGVMENVGRHPMQIIFATPREQRLSERGYGGDE